jgi:protein CpxP
MKTGRMVRVAVVFIAAMALAGEAAAQFGGGFPGGGGMGRRGGGMGGNQGGQSGSNERSVPNPNRESAAPQQQVVLEELRIDLKLTPAQQPAWNTYVDKLAAIAADAARERTRAQGMPQGNAPQQFDRAIDTARNRLTALEDVAVAAKALYASLSDEQKVVADTRLARAMPGATEPRQAGGMPDRQPDRQMGRRRESQQN